MFLLSKDEATLLRSATGFYNNDRKWEVSDAGAGTTFRCSIQPDTESFKQVVETSGVRSEEFLVVYTKTKLQSADNGKAVTGSQGQPADKVKIDDDTYVVFMVKRWRAGINLSHYQCLLVREDANVNNN
jgi:hypothetical protein